MVILIFGSKSGLRDDFGQYDTKPIVLHRFLAKRLLEIVLPTPKVLGDQKLLERVSYMLKLKVTKFQLPAPNSFWTVLKKPAGGQTPPPPKSKIGSNIMHWIEERLEKVVVMSEEEQKLGSQINFQKN